MQFRRRRKVDANIDMTPMIDTLLQLFVAFLLSMSFVASAVRLDLPKASAANAAPAEVIVVVVDAAQQLFLNDEPVAADVLPGRLQALTLKHPGKKVLLRADRTLPYEKVLQTLVALQQAGVGQVQLAYDDVLRGAK